MGIRSKKEEKKRTHPRPRQSRLKKKKKDHQFHPSSQSLDENASRGSMLLLWNSNRQDAISQPSGNAILINQTREVKGSLESSNAPLSQPVASLWTLLLL